MEAESLRWWKFHTAGELITGPLLVTQTASLAGGEGTVGRAGGQRSGRTNNSTALSAPPLYHNKCCTTLLWCWWCYWDKTERMKILIFHKCKGRLIEEFKTFNFHQTQTQLPVPSCTVTRSPTSQAPPFIRNTCWFPREPPIASQRRWRSNGLLPCGVCQKRSKGDTTLVKQLQNLIA